ncbi:hypothetical protein LZ636_17870, partial [Proteus terrae]
MTLSSATLYQEIEQLSLREQQRLRKRLRGVAKINNEESKQAVLSAIKDDITTAQQMIIRRRANCPEITYPENLPVSQKKDAIYNAIRDNQV